MCRLCWTDVSVVEKTCRSYKELQFGSQHMLGISQLPVHTTPQSLITSSRILWPPVYTHTHNNNSQNKSFLKGRLFYKKQTGSLLKGV